MLDALTGTLEGGRPLVSVTSAPSRRKAKSPTCCARPSSGRGVAIGSYPFFKEGPIVVARRMGSAKAVAEELAGKLAEVGYEPVAGGSGNWIRADHEPVEGWLTR